MRQFNPKRLLARRIKKGITQVALSRLIGISQASICAIEKGRKEPRTGTLAKFAHALECSLDYFFV